MDNAPGNIPVESSVEAARPTDGRDTDNNGSIAAAKPTGPSEGLGIGGNGRALANLAAEDDGPASATKPDLNSPEPNVPHEDDGDELDPAATPEVGLFDSLDPARLPKSPVAGSITPTRNALPRIETVNPGRGGDPETIRVAAGGKLIVPREDIGADIIDDAELDLAGMLAQKVRKPGRREWIALNPASELTTRLLLHKPKADGIEVEHYYVARGLRAPIHDELKDVRVFVYFSYTTKAHALWIVNVTIDNSWYESLQTLFQQPAGFFEANAVRVLSDKDNARYRVKHKPLPGPVTWPTRSTEELLGEALGHERFIMTADHPIYRDLVEGIELA